MLILLMAFLFLILFWWQKKIEQAGYFANIYQDTIADIETNRLSQPYKRKWDQHAYWDEIAVRPSKRGQKWIDQDPKNNKKPEPDEKLARLAENLGREYLLFDATRVLDEPTYVTPLPGYSGENRRPGSWPPGIGQAPSGHSDSGESTEQLNPDQREFQEVLKNFRNKANAWARRASEEAWSFYQEDLKRAQDEGRKQARRAIKVDLSALRGRGPEFVLEFTAIVVIIFAAVILGVMGLLGNEQIGTLLAAIAGYVLGKSVAGARTSPTEQPSGPDQGGKGRTDKGEQE